MSRRTQEFVMVFIFGGFWLIMALMLSFAITDKEMLQLGVFIVIMAPVILAGVFYMKIVELKPMAHHDASLIPELKYEIVRLQGLLDDSAIGDTLKRHLGYTPIDTKVIFRTIFENRSKDIPAVVASVLKYFDEGTHAHILLNASLGESAEGLPYYLYNSNLEDETKHVLRYLYRALPTDDFNMIMSSYRNSIELLKLVNEFIREQNELAIDLVRHLLKERVRNGIENRLADVAGLIDDGDEKILVALVGSDYIGLKEVLIDALNSKANSEKLIIPFIAAYRSNIVNSSITKALVSKTQEIPLQETVIRLMNPKKDPAPADVKLVLESKHAAQIISALIEQKNEDVVSVNDWIAGLSRAREVFAARAANTVTPHHRLVVAFNVQIVERSPSIQSS